MRGAAVLCAAVASGAVWAQDAPLPEAAPAFASPVVAAPAPAATPSVAADQLLGLRDAPSPPVVSFDDALREAAARHVDLRVAREKVVQQEQEVRKAWSYLLPHVDVSGTYTFNCTFLGDVTASCDDQTVQFADPETIQAQATLFDSIGDLLDQVAATQEEEDAAETRRNAAQLHDAADRVRATDVSPVVVQPAHVFAGGAQVSMPLFNGRAIPLLLNAYEGVDVVRATADQGRAAVLYAAARGYVAAASSRRLVDIARRRLEIAGRQRADAEARAEARTIAPLTLKGAQLDEVRARQQVRAAEHAHRSALAGLGSLIGRTALFDVAPPPPVDTTGLGDDVEALVARALAARPEVRAQRHALRIAERTRVDAWAMFLPSIGLFARAGATSNSNGFVDAPVNGAVGLQATLPLYDGGLRYASLRQSASRVREELLRARALEDRIAAQVRGNAAEVAVREEALAIAREALGVAAEGRAQAEALQEAGVGTGLDVLETSLAAFVAEADVARAELDLEAARLGLLYALGAFPRAAGDAAPLGDDEEQRARDLLAP